MGNRTPSQNGNKTDRTKTERGKRKIEERKRKYKMTEERDI